MLHTDFTKQQRYILLDVLSVHFQKPTVTMRSRCENVPHAHAQYAKSDKNTNVITLTSLVISNLPKAGLNGDFLFTPYVPLGAERTNDDDDSY